MKRLLLLLPLLAALLFPAPPRPVSATDGRYAVCVQDVWFYAGENEEEKLFLVPDTYYVRVLEEGEIYSTVEYLTDDPPYKKLLGYCRTDQLLFVDFIPVRPYLRKQITVSYTVPGSGSLDDAFSTVERTFVYYGDRYENGQLYLYVLLDGTFGYIPASAPPEYEHNTDYLTSTSGDGDEGTEPPSADEGIGATQIVVICLACAAAVAIVIILMRGKQKPGGEQQEF